MYLKVQYSNTPRRHVLNQQSLDREVRLIAFVSDVEEHMISRWVSGVNVVSFVEICHIGCGNTDYSWG